MKSSTRSAVVLGAAGAIVIGSLVGAGSALAARPPIAKSTALSSVLADVPGQLIKVSRAKRDGFRAWAVTVEREDGSIVVGYVDRRTGIIFDWTVQQAPNEPVMDLDGPDKSREPAARPPTVGEPLTATATVDLTQARPVQAAVSEVPSTPRTETEVSTQEDRPSASDSDSDSANESNESPNHHDATQTDSHAAQHDDADGNDRRDESRQDVDDDGGHDADHHDGNDDHEDGHDDDSSSDGDREQAPIAQTSR